MRVVSGAIMRAVDSQSKSRVGTPPCMLEIVVRCFAQLPQMVHELAARLVPLAPLKFPLHMHILFKSAVNNIHLFNDSTVIRVSPI